MNFYSYKDILDIAVYSYFNSVEERHSKITNHGPTTKNIVTKGITEIEQLLLNNVELSNSDFGLIVSNYPVLVDYIPRSIWNELVRGRSKTQDK